MGAEERMNELNKEELLILIDSYPERVFLHPDPPIPQLMQFLLFKDKDDISWPILAIGTGSTHVPDNIKEQIDNLIIQIKYK